MWTMLDERYAQLPIFRGLSKEQIDQIEPLLQLCQFPKNTTIFLQGQTTDYFHILLKGEVEIRYKPYDAPPLVVARMQPGNVFGWSSVLRRDTYTSSAISVTKVITYSVLFENVRKMYLIYPVTGDILLERLADGVAERIHSTHVKVLSLIKEGL
jgi:CRP/FNR family transcriptional regulator, cyclic AMP receptor protein